MIKQININIRTLNIDKINYSRKIINDLIIIINVIGFDFEEINYINNDQKKFLQELLNKNEKLSKNTFKLINSI